MSGTGAREQAGPAGAPQVAGGQAGPVLPPAAAGGRRRNRRRWAAAIAAGAVVVAGASVAALALAGVFTRPGHPGSGSGHGMSTATVTRQTLTSQTSVNATLGYAGSYTVAVRGAGSPGSGSSGPGTLTWLPAAGRVIREGQVLYRTDNGVAGVPAVRAGAGVADAEGGDDRAGRVPAQPRPGRAGVCGQRVYRRAGLGFLLLGDQVRAGAAADRAGPDGDRGAAVGPGGVRAARPPRGQRVGAAGLCGVRAGVLRDVGAAGGDGQAGRLPAVRGAQGRQGDGHHAGREVHAGRDLRGGQGCQRDRELGHDHRAMSGSIIRRRPGGWTRPRLP